MEEEQERESEGNKKEENKSESSISEFDIKSLENQAMRAVNNESYQVLASDDNYRLGLSMIITNDGELLSAIELLFCILKSHSKVEKYSLEWAVNVANILTKRNYTLYHQDDGWIICEKRLDPREILTEIEFLKDLIKMYHRIRKSDENEDKKIYDK
jgi:hypothetical protein